MEIQSDYKELLELFNAHQVEYLIVGSYALAFYGAPRFTGDIDIFVKPDKENAQRILDVLSKFGFTSLELSVEDFQKEDNVIQLGVPPVRIDFLTSLSGVSWDEAYAEKVSGSYGTIPVFYLGRNQFIANKKSLGRKKDLADIEAIEKNDS